MIKHTKIQDEISNTVSAASSPQKSEALQDNRALPTLQMKLAERRDENSDIDENPQPVQRTVLSKIYKLVGKNAGSITKYYSTHDHDDPIQEFDKYADAVKLDVALAKQNNGNFKEDARYPTSFTHYNVRPTSVSTSSKSGPHTLSHSSTAYRLADQIKKRPLKELRDEQVPNPAEFNYLLETERPSKTPDDNINRCKKDYELLYNRLDDIINGKKKTYPDEAHELLMRLMQLHPYTVYGKGSTVSKSRIKGKGERKEDHFKEAFDENAKFKSKENYNDFKQGRKRLYESESEEESEDESINKSKKRKLEDKPVKRKRESDDDDNDDE